MEDIDRSLLRFHRRAEGADAPFRTFHAGGGVDAHVGMTAQFPFERSRQSAGVAAAQGEGCRAQVAAQLAFPLHQMYRMAETGEIEGRAHPRRPAAHHQDGAVEPDPLPGGEARVGPARDRPGHRLDRAREVAGLGRLPEVAPLEDPRVDAHLPEHVLVEPLHDPVGAGREHEPVGLLLGEDLPHLVHPRLGAAVADRGDEIHARECLDAGGELLEIEAGGVVSLAGAEDHADPDRFVSEIGREGSAGHRLLRPAPCKGARRQGGRSGPFASGLGDVLRPAEGAADEEPRQAGFTGGELVLPFEAVEAAGDAEKRGQFARLRVLFEPRRQHDEVVDGPPELRPLAGHGNFEGGGGRVLAHARRASRARAGCPASRAAVR